MENALVETPNNMFTETVVLLFFQCKNTVLVLDVNSYTDFSIMRIDTNFLDYLKDKVDDSVISVINYGNKSTLLTAQISSILSE